MNLRGATGALIQRVQIVVRRVNSAQTANLLEAQDQAGAILARIDKDGKFYGVGGGAAGQVLVVGDTAGGDLSGTYPSPSVVDDSHSHTGGTISLAHGSLTGVTSDQHHNRAHTLQGLSDHSDIDTTAPSDGQLLSWNAGLGKWKPASVSGNVATDAIWDVKGDLAVGTGANAASRLAVGANSLVLTADSGEATGLKWAPASGSVPSALQVVLANTFV